jgi:flavin reductase (DIM6/NTAB) family NADH-FMN oxidoreductase RutF
MHHTLTNSLVLEYKLLQRVEIGLHTQFIGEIRNIKVESDMIKDDDSLIEKIKPIIYSPDSLSYYGVGE